MHISNLAVAATVVAASFSSVVANMAPSTPAPGTICTEGQACLIEWKDDGTSPSITQAWTSFNIDFMTGSNDNQTTLTRVASGLNGVTSTSYSWTPPTVSPHSAIYFFMFSNGTSSTPASEVGYAWTTRFTIVAADGTSVTPEYATQPTTNEAIPWGNGAIVSGVTTGTSTTKSSAVNVTPSIGSSSTSSSPSSTNNKGSPNSGEKAHAKASLVLGALSAAVLAALIV